MAAGSKFFSHIKTWVFFIPILMVFVVPLADVDWIYTINQDEIDSNVAVFGDAKHQKIVEDTDQQFAHLFIENGLYHKTLDNNRGGQNTAFGAQANSFVNSYFDHLWKMVYRALYRMHIAWQWLTGGLILICAFLYDGWQARNIKKHSISIGNPLAVHLVLHSFFLLAGLSVTLCFLPIAISTRAWGIGILLASLFAWKLAESFQSSN